MRKIGIWRYANEQMEAPMTSFAEIQRGEDAVDDWRSCVCDRGSLTILPNSDIHVSDAVSLDYSIAKLTVID